MKNTADTAVEKKDAAANVKANETMMLGDSELGDVKIHDGVIATLTRRAALAIDGVSRLAGNALVDNLAEIVGSRRMQARAITISVNESNQISIEIKLNLKIGFTIPEVAENVQKAVIADVEKVTGMTVTSVHVLVQDIDDESSFDEDEDGEEI